MNWETVAQHYAKLHGTHAFEHAEVTLADLKIDVYERPVSPTQVSEMLDEWNIGLARELQISERINGDLYIVDGIHTSAALQIKGFTTWGARIHKGLTLEDEARLFADYNESQRKVAAEYHFRAELIAKTKAKDYPRAQEIAAVLASHGLAVKSTEKYLALNGVATLGSPTMLEALWTRGGKTDGGKEFLAETLDLAKSAWYGRVGISTSDAYNTRVMPGLATLLLNTTQPLDKLRLIDTLASMSPKEIEKLVRGVSGANSIVALEIHSRYIEGRNGQRKVYVSSHYPYLATRVIRFDEPVGRISVWTKTRGKMNLQGAAAQQIKSSYLY